MSIPDAEWRKVKELVYVLAGQIGDGSQAAVRGGTVNQLTSAVSAYDKSRTDAGKVTITPASLGHVTAPPSVTDFNLLLDDLNALRSQLEQIQSAVSS